MGSNGIRLPEGLLVRRSQDEIHSLSSKTREEESRSEAALSLIKCS